MAASIVLSVSWTMSRMSNGASSGSWIYRLWSCSVGLGFMCCVTERELELRGGVLSEGFADGGGLGLG